MASHDKLQKPARKRKAAKSASNDSAQAAYVHKKFRKYNGSCSGSCPPGRCGLDDPNLCPQDTPSASIRGAPGVKAEGCHGDALTLKRGHGAVSCGEKNQMNTDMIKPNASIKDTPAEPATEGSDNLQQSLRTAFHEMSTADDKQRREINKTVFALVCKMYNSDSNESSAQSPPPREKHVAKNYQRDQDNFGFGAIRSDRELYSTTNDIIKSIIYGEKDTQRKVTEHIEKASARPLESSSAATTKAFPEATNLTSSRRDAQSELKRKVFGTAGLSPLRDFCPAAAKAKDAHQFGDHIQRDLYKFRELAGCGDHQSYGAIMRGDYKASVSMDTSDDDSIGSLSGIRPTSTTVAVTVGYQETPHSDDDDTDDSFCYLGDLKAPHLLRAQLCGAQQHHHASLASRVPMRNLCTNSPYYCSEKHGGNRGISAVGMMNNFSVYVHGS